MSCNLIPLVCKNVSNSTLCEWDMEHAKYKSIWLSNPIAVILDNTKTVIEIEVLEEYELKYEPGSDVDYAKMEIINPLSYSTLIKHIDEHMSEFKKELSKAELKSVIDFKRMLKKSNKYDIIMLDY